MSEYYCDCGNELDYIDNEWAKYNFSDSELQHWANKLLNTKKNHPQTKILAYFNNHFSGYAVKNALDILPKLNQKPLNDISTIHKNFQQDQKSKRKVKSKLKIEQEEHKTLDRWVK